jgi:hypothetical protein
VATCEVSWAKRQGQADAASAGPLGAYVGYHWHTPPPILCYLYLHLPLQFLCKQMKSRVAGTRFLIQGFGKMGGAAAELLQEQVGVCWLGPWDALNMGNLHVHPASTENQHTAVQHCLPAMRLGNVHEMLPGL